MVKRTAHIDRVITSVTSGKAAAQSRLAASWQRSYEKHGLDPTARARATDPWTERLKDRQDELGQVLRLAAPKLDDLFAMVGHGGCGVFLTDSDGMILDCRSSSSDADAFAGWGLGKGHVWSEANQGTNGIGTCLAESRPVTIHRDQHFLPENIGMSCIDAPVFGHDGELVAALDVSSARADQTEGFNRLIEGMVIQVARQIEADLFRTAYQDARIVLCTGDEPASAALLAVDGDDVVIGATREARRHYRLEQKGQVAPRPLVDLMGRNEAGPAGLERAERAAVIRALTRSGGNVTQAARALGLGRATLYRRMKRLGIGENQG